MQNRFDIASAPVPPLRAEPRPGLSPRPGPDVDREGHIRGVATSSAGLIRATLGAAAGAATILVLFWLPAEYGIDPTGFGRLTGLSEMGEIKQQLAAEAATDAAKPAAPALAPADTSAIVARLAAIETQLAALTRAMTAGETVAATAPAATPTSTAPAWRDSWSYTLPPGEGIEAKLRMTAGAKAKFEWTATGGVLNHDMHGDGGGQEISYEKGRGVPGQSGVLTAAFSGNHGWFWRNRSDAPVTVTLNVRGDYERLLTP